VILARASVLAALAASILACASFAAPAAAEPRVIPAPSYLPDEPGLSRRYYRDDGVAVRRAGRSGERSRYVEEMFEDDEDGVYRYQERRRIPRTRSRAVIDDDYAYERYEVRPRSRRASRSYRYYDYDDPSFEPYETREPTVEEMPRRLAGPPSAAGGREPVRRAMNPKFARTTVPYRGREPANSIVIDTKARFLYLVQGDGTAVRYGVGVGKEGFSWKGVEKISQKREWPDWRPPAEMRKRRPELPVHMAGGPDNPLGARALYLGSTLYRIHGSNEPWTIGQAVSSGCIRMTNEDVTDLYDRVGIGTIVKVI
jgi:lipoprotein-anchoring transpeptidase ErfK/SrfK